MPNKGMVILNSAAPTRTLNGDLDSSNNILNLIRADATFDISASLPCGSPTRTLYLTIGLAPNDPGASGGTDYLYANSRNLFFDYSHPTSGTASNDIYGSYSSINPTTISGVQYEYLDNIGPHPLSWGTGTGRGAAKIHDAVDAAWTLKNSYGWNIGFGVANDCCILCLLVGSRGRRD